MIKILQALLCLFITSTAFSQVLIIESFDSGTPTGWTGSSYFNSSTNPCAGNSERTNVYNSVPSANRTSPNQPGASNGTDITFSFDYKIVNYSFSNPTVPTGSGWGTAEMQYSTNDGSSWTTALLIDDNNYTMGNTCTNISTTILGASVPDGSDLKFRVLNTWLSGDYYFYVDNFNATQVVSDPPNCDAVLTSVMTDFPLNGTLIWSDATGVPNGYRITIGSSMGGNDIADDIDVGSATTYAPTGLMYSNTYYTTITPYNANGDATGCTEQSFVTSDPPPTGSLCEDPIDIGTLPYMSAAETTSGFGDDYTGIAGSSGCSSTSSFLNGDDIVYSYTSDEDGTINILLTNITDNYTGVFVYESCSDIGSACVGGDTNLSSTADLSITDLSVTNGQTIYIVVSTFAAPQTTTYDLTIEKPSIPNCDASLTSVTTDFPIDGDLTWSAATGFPSGYKVSIGSMSGLTDIANNEDVGLATSYAPTGLMYSTTYYATVIPYNSIGDAVGCAEETFSTEAQPQQGSLCIDPIDIGVLPYTSAAETTSGFGDDYSGSPGSSGCGSSSPFLNGDDKVYSFTPDEDGGINIDLTNILDTYTGVFVYNACGDIGATCGEGDVNFNSTADLSISEFAVTNGQTIYIVVSTNAAPQSTTYDLSISKVVPPNCDAVLTSATTDFLIDGDLTWSAATGDVSGYKISIGSMSGLTDIADNEDVGAATSYSPAGLIFSSTYYATIIPYNIAGDATGCVEQAFSTEPPPPQGSLCSDPIDVGTLPYSAAAETTSGFEDDYSGSPGSSGCGSTSAYLNGDDKVYSYTSDEDGDITIELTNITDNYSGVFVYSSCADIGTTCIGGAVNSSVTDNLSIVQGGLTNGQTIYIVVSTWASPQTTTYDLMITKNSTPPNCDAVLTSATTDFSIIEDLTWSAATGSPTGYKISIGSMSGLTDIANNIDVGSATTYAPTGLVYSTTYFVTITPYNGVGDATGCTEQTIVTQDPPPPGNICDIPIDVGTLPYNSAGETTSGFGDDYSGSPGSSGCGTTSPYLNGDDIVYAYTSDEEGDIKIELTNIEDNYTGVFVYSSCADIGSACIGGDNNTFTSADLTVQMNDLTIGQTIYIVISTNAAPQTTTYDLSITKIIPVPNDDACDAIELTVDAAQIPGTNDGATVETNEDPGSCWSPNTVGNSVWYTFVAPGSGLVEVTTDFVTGLDDTQMALYSVTDCGDLLTANEIACSEDDGVTGSGYMAVIETSGAPLTGGDTYYVQVEGYTTGVGAFEIQVNELPPANDDCAAAAVLAMGTTGSLINQYFAASTDSGMAAEACDGSATPTPNDIWYSIDTDADGGNLIVVVEPGPNSDVVVSVYDDCGSIVPEACVDLGGNGVTETINFNADFRDDKGNTSSTRAATYFVRVYEKTSSGEPFEIGAQGEALPIVLGSFEALAEKRGNKVQWTTLTEINSDYVEVQSSPNGSTKWEPVGRVATKGESTSKVDYELFDFNPYAITYYRLNAVDKDGKAELSRVINVKRSDNLGKMSLSPNPTTSSISLQTVSTVEEIGAIRVMDMTGKIMKNESINLRKGLNTFSIELYDLNPGIYLFSLQTAEGTQVEKIIKQ